MQKAFGQLYDETRTAGPQDDSDHIDFQGTVKKLVSDILGAYAKAYVEGINRMLSSEIDAWVNILLLPDHKKISYTTLLKESYSVASSDSRFNEGLWVSSMRAIREAAKRRLTRLRKQIEVRTSIYVKLTHLTNYS